MTLDAIIAELLDRATDEGAFEHEVINAIHQLQDIITAGLFPALRLYTDEIKALRALRDGLVTLRDELRQEWAAENEVAARIDVLLAIVPKGGS